MGLVEFIKSSVELTREVRDPKLLAKVQELQALAAGIQVEHASLVEQRLQTMTENTALKLKVAEYEKQVICCEKCELKHHVSEEFVEYRGGLFKAKPGGGYHDFVFCPQCKKPMVSFNKLAPFTCNDCHTAVDFNGRELWRVMQGLPRTEG